VTLAPIHIPRDAAAQDVEYTVQNSPIVGALSTLPGRWKLRFDDVPLTIDKSNRMVY
jgi:hypothetical protein